MTMMTTDKTPLTLGVAHDWLHDSGAQFYVEVDEDGDVDLRLRDYSDFHMEHADLSKVDVGIVRMVAVNAIPAAFDPSHRVSVEVDASLVDLYYFAGRAEDYDSLEDAIDRLWPVIAAFVNVTDPGTFGSEYIFTHAR